MQRAGAIRESRAEYQRHACRAWLHVAQSCVGECLTRCAHREVLAELFRERVRSSGFARGARDDRASVNPEGVGRKTADRRDPAPPLGDGGPERTAVLAERADRPESGDHDVSRRAVHAHLSDGAAAVGTGFGSDVASPTSRTTSPTSTMITPTVITKTPGIAPAATTPPPTAVTRRPMPMVLMPRLMRRWRFVRSSAFQNTSSPTRAASWRCRASASTSVSATFSTLSMYSLTRSDGGW